jgi:hypothetical protein
MEAMMQTEPKTLEVRVKELAAYRAQAAEATAKVNALLEQVKADNADLFETEKNLKTLVDSAERELREHAVVMFLRGECDKKPCEGVGIRVTTNYNFDNAQALEWCRENARVCILPESLDVKKFNGLIKDEATRPDFVQVETTPTATIATDLSALLEG